MQVTKAGYQETYDKIRWGASFAHGRREKEKMAFL
jgi:hypothetical protein